MWMNSFTHICLSLKPLVFNTVYLKAYRMSSKKAKSEKKFPDSQSVRVHIEIIEKLALLGDVLDTTSYNDTINAVIQKAFPNIDKLVEIHRSKELERKNALRDSLENEE